MPHERESRLQKPFFFSRKIGGRKRLLDKLKRLLLGSGEEGGIKMDCLNLSNLPQGTQNPPQKGRKPVILLPKYSGTPKFGYSTILFFPILCKFPDGHEEGVA